MRKIEAKKGLDIECKGWEQEAVLRMLLQRFQNLLIGGQGRTQAEIFTNRTIK